MSINAADPLPRYLRFIKRVVDSADLPLNISRQNITSGRRHIARVSTRYSALTCFFSTSTQA